MTAFWVRGNCGECAANAVICKAADPMGCGLHVTPQEQGVNLN
jgi:hypothetical protein